MADRTEAPAEKLPPAGPEADNGPLNDSDMLGGILFIFSNKLFSIFLVLLL